MSNNEMFRRLGVMINNIVNDSPGQLLAGKPVSDELDALIEIVRRYKNLLDSLDV